jgi:cell division protein FtsW
MAGLAGAYIMVPHVTQRVDSFLHPGSGDTFQVDTAREAILNGGWLGQGPGEGTVKRILPDAHTDFIFAVAAEEFGIIACVLLVLVFAFIVLRGMSHALRERDPFVRLAAAGLSVLIGVQAGINMAVNLGLAPAKGMTLPMVSYGGSSLISVAIAIGMILALTRRRPGSRVMLDGGGIGATA